MDLGWVATLITAMVGIFGTFFGRSHWKLLQSLVSEQANRITYINAQVEALRHDKSLLYQKLDKYERAYYACVGDGNVKATMIDNYIAQIEKLQLENSKLKQRLDKVKPLA